MGLVVKSWAAALNPVDQQGNFIVIQCRQEGIIAFILTAIGLDVKTTLLVSPDRVEYVEASLSGSKRRLIPLTSISSTYYGFEKPLKATIGIIAAAIFTLLPILTAGERALGDLPGAMLCPLAFVFLVIVGALIYYFLNKKISLGILEVSGWSSGIQFKRSLIEGKKIDEQEARHVCDIVQSLIEAHLLKK